MSIICCFFFKQKTADDMRISDWSSDVCSSDLIVRICGLDYAIWTLRAEPKHANKWRLLAIRFARDVEHLMTDPRSVAALDAANNHASYGLCDMELIKARMAAWGAGPSTVTPTDRQKLAATAAADRKNDVTVKRGSVRV